MDGLTQKQETFTRNIFSGMNQYDAYTGAGYAICKQTRATIDSNASRLANNVKVRLRLDELNKRAEDPAVLTVKERKGRLSELAQEPVKQPVTAKEVIMSIGELNKMEHIYEAQPAEGVTIVNSFTFILPNGTRVSPKELREVNVIQGQREPEEITTGVSGEAERDNAEG